MDDDGQWKELASEDVKCADDVDPVACFNRIMLIYRYYGPKLSSEVKNVSDVDRGSEEYRQVLALLPEEKVRFLFAKQIDVEMRQLSISRYGKNADLDTRQYDLSYETPGTSEEHSVTFIPLRTDDLKINHHLFYDHRITCKVLDANTVRLAFLAHETAENSFNHVRQTIFPALVRWLSSVDPDQKLSVRTNSLINYPSYLKRYDNLKKKYCKRYAEIWNQSERTDPQKYVYEDCGIASYLLETFARLDLKPKCFVDMGCGNGLLVRLLNAQDVPGIGLDLRSRRIWPHFQSEGADLRVHAIDPVSDSGLPPDADFLIGNHSDELTPWIIVMAARLRCSFFVLPCCPFDFQGKYQTRPGVFTGKYDAYLHFIRRIGEKLGYIVEQDRLAISSTRRLCYVGRIPPTGLPPAEIIEAILPEIMAPIGDRKEFCPRPAEIPIRNCTAIPAEIKVQMAKKIFDALLAASDERIDGWRRGGKLALSEVMDIFSEEEKSYLKQQHGGLQTFLKNNHQIFSCHERGVAQIRDFREPTLKKKPKNKLSRCWMLDNHPDGCPYGEGCWFKHE